MDPNYESRKVKILRNNLENLDIENIGKSLEDSPKEVGFQKHRRKWNDKILKDSERVKFGQMEHCVDNLGRYVNHVGSMRSGSDYHSYYKNFFIEPLLEEINKLRNRKSSGNKLVGSVEGLKNRFYKLTGVEIVDYYICANRNCRKSTLQKRRRCPYCDYEEFDEAVYIPFSIIINILNHESCRNSLLVFDDEELKKMFGKKEKMLVDQYRKRFKNNKNIVFLNIFVDAFKKHFKRWASIGRILNYRRFKDGIKYDRLFLNCFASSFDPTRSESLEGFLKPMILEMRIFLDYPEDHDFVVLLSTLTADFEARSMLISVDYQSECSICNNVYRMGSYSNEEFDLCELSRYQRSSFHWLSYFSCIVDIVFCSLHLFDIGVYQNIMSAIDRERFVEEYRLQNEGDRTYNNVVFHGSGAGHMNKVVFMCLPAIVPLNDRRLKLMKVHKLLKELRSLLRSKNADIGDLKRREEVVVSKVNHFLKKITPKLHHVVHYHMFYYWHGPIWYYSGYSGESIFSFAKDKILSKNVDKRESVDLFLLKNLIPIVRDILHPVRKIRKKYLLLQMMRNGLHRKCFIDGIVELEKNMIVKLEFRNSDPAPLRGSNKSILDPYSWSYAKVVGFKHPGNPYIVVIVYTELSVNRRRGYYIVNAREMEVTSDWSLDIVKISKTNAVVVGEELRICFD